MTEEEKKFIKSRKNEGSKLVGDIGEAIVSYELFMRGWHPTKNFLGGYDVLIIKGHKIRKIEIKTRSFQLEQTNFMVSKMEMRESDFIICNFYLLPDWYLIVKTKDVYIDPKTKKGIIAIYLNKERKFNSKKYNNNLNNWELLE